MILKKNIKLREGLRLDEPLEMRRGELLKIDTTDIIKDCFFSKPEMLLSDKITELRL